MKAVVTGAAGFIGSNLVDQLLIKGYEVVGIDNLATGNLDNLRSARANSRFHFAKLNIADVKELGQAIDKADIVFHLSANADVRFGFQDPFRDFNQNAKLTLTLLETMREKGIYKLVFSSTGSIYGESETIPTPENAPFPIQTSLYGASKISAEAFIEAYCTTFGFQAWILRFVSILGERYSHGHVIDFYKQLKSNPNKLEVLGNGLQQKSYLHVGDCVEGVLKSLEYFQEKINIVNLGHDEICTVKDSVSWICDEMKLYPEVRYGTEKQGWIGDNPLIHLDNSKLKSTGWNPKYSIEQSVKMTIRYLASEL